MYHVLKRTRQYGSTGIHESVEPHSERGTWKEAHEYAKQRALKHAWDIMTDPPVEMANGEFRFYTSNMTYVVYLAVQK